MSTKFTGTQLFAGAVTVVVAIAVVIGLITAGSPMAERMRRADQQRVSDLQSISYAIDAYWAQNAALPATLEDLARSPDVYIQSVRDPETANPYGYAPADQGAYQLCATFQTDSDSGPDRPMPLQPANFWTHGVGERCFPLEARNDGVMMTQAPIRID
jgi:hypothetical protein